MGVPVTSSDIKPASLLGPAFSTVLGPQRSAPILSLVSNLLLYDLNRSPSVWPLLNFRIFIVKWEKRGLASSAHSKPIGVLGALTPLYTSPWRSAASDDGGGG